MNKTENITERPPVVCIMGHIDHGKSTLLDYIRKTNVVAGEAGGITQKISAYEVTHPAADGTDKKITFLDTPGHEAFSAIRARGGNVADIAILIVSAEDGVKKQTLEALACIVGNKLPYIVAITKIDKPSADVERAKMSLIENGIYLEGFGGNIPYVPISSKTGQGIKELLDLLLLVAEMEELKGDHERQAEGAVIEATLDSKKGISASLIIKDGSIKSGSYIVCGDSIAPTRMMENFLGKKITEATFSSPVKVIGFSKLPKVGMPFTTFNSKKEAEEFAIAFKEVKIGAKKEDSTEAEKPSIEVIIKAQNVGALEGIAHEIEKIKNDYVKIKIVASGVGDITEGDVKAATSKTGTILVGFDVKTDPQAIHLAERDGLEIKTFDIIYKIAEWLEAVALAKKPIIESEEMTGRAKILKTFSTVKDKHVIGARVEEGSICSGDDVKILRQEVEIGRGKIREIQQQKEKVKEVNKGVEFGCMFQTDVALAPGDKFEAFKIVKK